MRTQQCATLRVALAVLAALAALAPSIAAAEPETATLFVGRSELSPSLVARIDAEIDPASLVDRAEDAELVLAVLETPSELRIELRTRAGAPVVVRTFSFKDGRTAAERLAVLAVVEALRSPELTASMTSTVAVAPAAVEPAPEPEESAVFTTPPPRASTDEPRTWTIALGVAAQLTTWARTPQFGAELAGAIEWPRVDAGLAVGAVGGAPALASGDEIRARLLGVYLLGQAQGSVVELAGWNTGPALALGAVYLNLEARPIAFVGEEIPIRRTHWTGVGRIGWSVRSPPFTSLAFSLRLAVGLEVRFSNLSFGLPPNFAIDGTELAKEPLRTGVFAPYLLLGAAGDLF